MPAQNYTVNLTSGITNISCGKYTGDIGILLIGDSNMCGAGGGTRPTLVNNIYQWNNDTNTITQLNGSDPVFNHTLNTGLNEVGPDTSFCDKYATERGGSQRVVGLPCGNWGTGFQNDWNDTEPMFELMQEITNKFLSDSPGNTIGAVVIMLGENDAAWYVPDTLWRDEYESFIDAIRSTAFAGNASQPNLNTTPIICTGTPPDWYTGDPENQAIQDYITATPGRKLYTGYANTDALSSQAGDAGHFSGASNITLGSTRMWTALLAAEINT